MRRARGASAASLGPAVRRMGGELKAGRGTAAPMRSKLLTPLNVGAFHLRHRIVVDWGRTEPGRDEISGQVVVTALDPCLWGGLVIYDAGLHLLPPEDGTPAGATARSGAVWHSTISRLKTTGQISLARLTDDFAARGAESRDTAGLQHHDIDQIISVYVASARRAKSIGFDGIELDGAFDSVTDRVLLEYAKAQLDMSGGPADQGINFVIELVGALTGVFGRDRVGVRLAPFARDKHPPGSRNVFDQALRALAEQEIAYVHLLGTTSPGLRGASAEGGTSAARALRRAYPGILIGSGRRDLSHAIELVESRWADGVCLPGTAIDTRLSRHMRSLWHGGELT